MSSPAPPSSATDVPAVPARSPRIDAIDWLRGLVMVLMTLDHASESFNRGRFVTDTAALWTPGRELPVAQFLTRWVTHLCAPTFVFLAGAALALSAERRSKSGDASSPTRFLLSRGLFILLLDPLWVSRFWFPSGVLFQVMFAIGASMICMAGLRRVGPRVLVGLSLAWLVFGELAITALRASPSGPNLLLALTLLGGMGQRWLFIAYPLVPWLSIMMLGYGFGWFLVSPAPQRQRQAILLLLAGGLASLAVFAVVRGYNGYGNLGLLRDGMPLLQWLHVSKYPPSLSFVTLELGIMALLLALLMQLGSSARASEDSSGNGPASLIIRALTPLRTLGQTALFFYVLHIPLLHLGSYALGMHRQGGAGAAYLAALAAVVMLYPLCSWYGRYKARHPRGWTRYL